MRYGSLFAGVGGFDLGLERAGMECVWQVENDKQCQAVLRKRFPGAEVFGDVRTVKAVSEVCRRQTADNRGQAVSDGGGGLLEPVDVITAGFPCQDLSVAGRREGLGGERSGLFFQIVRIVEEMREETRGQYPTILLLENVPGLLSSHGGKDFAVILAELANLGAVDIGWRILDSQWFGVPQRRRRVFIVADFRAERVAEVLALSEGLYGHPAPSREAGQDIAGSVGGRAAGEGGFRQDLDNHGAYPLAFDTTQITSKLNRSQPKPGNPCHPLAAGAHAPAVAYPLEPSGEAQPAHTTVPRRLTPLETERLQAFPDDWTRWGRNEDGTRVEMKDGPRYRMCGNAVTVNVIEWIARRIVDATAREALLDEGQKDE